MATMKTRMYYVIYFEKLDKKTKEVIEVEHSRTRDRFDSMNTLDDLIKAGIKARCQTEFF